MGVWDTYAARANVRGDTKRETHLRREIRNINRKVPESLSYDTVIIYPPEYGYNITSDEMMEHRIEQQVAMIDSDNLDEKTLLAMPGDDVTHGSLVFWMDNYWLVIERDPNTTVRTKCKLQQCNHLLQWMLPDGTVAQQWSYVEDGTKLERIQVICAMVWYMGNCVQKESL